MFNPFKNIYSKPNYSTYYNTYTNWMNLRVFDPYIHSEMI